MKLRDFFDARWSADCFLRPLGTDGALPNGRVGLYCMAIELPESVFVVYIGKAINLRGRLRGHAGCNFAYIESEAYWAWRQWLDEKGGEPVLFTRTVEQPGECRQLEIEAIAAFRPSQNEKNNYANGYDRRRPPRPDPPSLEEMKFWMSKVEF